MAREIPISCGFILLHLIDYTRQRATDILKAMMAAPYGDILRRGFDTDTFGASRLIEGIRRQSSFLRQARRGLRTVNLPNRICTGARPIRIGKSCGTRPCHRPDATRQFWRPTQTSQDGSTRFGKTKCFAQPMAVRIGRRLKLTGLGLGYSMSNARWQLRRLASLFVIPLKIARPHMRIERTRERRHSWERKSSPCSGPTKH